jgi:hypothetical protein
MPYWLYLLSGASFFMSPVLIPKRMEDDLHKFIYSNYPNTLPHSLLVAQSFMLKFPKYGKEFSFSEITDAVEYLIK